MKSSSAFVLLQFLALSSVLAIRDGLMTDGSIAQERARVPIDLFVMSKCPDAIRCEARMAEVLKQVSSIVKVTLHYIANISDSQFAVCKHGDLECAGNAQQLCTKQYVQDDVEFWKFLQCQNANVTDIGLETLANACLERLRTDGEESEWALERARSCYYGKMGAALLLQSAREVERLRVKTSCTIWVNKKPRCVMDGGVWYNCPGGPEVTDFISSICTAYWSQTGQWPKVCTQS